MLNQDLMKLQKRGRLEDDVIFEKTLWIHEQRPNPKKESIQNTEVGCSPSGSIDHDELMFNQQAFCYHRPCTTRPQQFPEGDKKMNDEQ